MKRKHIRLPLFHVNSLVVCSPINEEDVLPKEIKCFKWDDVVRDLGNHHYLIDYICELHSKFGRTESLYWKEISSSAVAHSLKGLLNDRKVCVCRRIFVFSVLCF
jgi:hypothetical protein